MLVASHDTNTNQNDEASDQADDSDNETAKLLMVQSQIDGNKLQVVRWNTACAALGQNFHISQ